MAESKIIIKTFEYDRNEYTTLYMFQITSFDSFSFIFWIVFGGDG